MMNLRQDLLIPSIRIEAAGNTSSSNQSGEAKKPIVLRSVNIFIVLSQSL